VAARSIVVQCYSKHDDVTDIHAIFYFFVTKHLLRRPISGGTDGPVYSVSMVDDYLFFI